MTLPVILNVLCINHKSTWRYYQNTGKCKKEVFMKEIDLFCSDGHWATAKAKYSQKKWTIFVVSKDNGDLDYKKVLFDTTYDEIIAFNSMSGVSYVAVKKAELWGLIRFRQDKENYRIALGDESIDKKAVDPLGREIKLMEDIKYPDINYFKKKYHLDNSYRSYSSIGDKELYEIPGILPEWSDTAIENTKDVLLNFSFGGSTVRMKRIDGSFGFIPLADALNHKYNVHHDEDGNIDHYNNVSEMIEDGWVVD